MLSGMLARREREKERDRERNTSTGSVGSLLSLGGSRFKFGVSNSVFHWGKASKHLQKTYLQIILSGSLASRCSVGKLCFIQTG